MDFLLLRIPLNVLVMMSFSPVGAVFREQARRFQGLVNGKSSTGSTRGLVTPLCGLSRVSWRSSRQLATHSFSAASRTTRATPTSL
jgi:hypothetical protein